MNMIFACEGKFIKNSSGDIYGVNGGFTNTLWKRYLKIFQYIIVMARVTYEADYQGKVEFIANSDKVEFIELPSYTGAKGFLFKRNAIKNIIRKNICDSNVYLCRLPGTIGSELIRQLKYRNISYACEVVGDPWEVFAPGVIRHPLRPLIRLYSRFNLRYEVKNSSCTLYVTKQALQQRYPARKNTYTTSISDVQLYGKHVVENIKIQKNKTYYELISVGSLEQLYKSPDIVIKAISELKKLGIICHLRWLGDGIFRTQLENLKRELDVDEEVEFIGVQPLDKVVEYLRESDIFILASRTEGMPRALIEAMAQGLPCIGTKVGGIPELLDEVALIEPNNAHELARKIKTFTQNKEIRNQQATRNLEEAKKYCESILQNRREIFYKEIIKQSGIL